jgi:hypothetical protein
VQNAPLQGGRWLLARPNGGPEDESVGHIRWLTPCAAGDKMR